MKFEQMDKQYMKKYEPTKEEMEVMLKGAGDAIEQLGKSKNEL